jgi:hypothetical protein
MRVEPRAAFGLTVGLATWFFSGDASAQTWSGGETTPSGLDLVAVDATGELLWPHGAEDVAGDGTTFEAAEQAVDVRTAYLHADAERLWARVYVSSPSAPAPDVKAFVFIDGDVNEQTGGPASATDVDPALTADPTGGGWEAILVLHGDGTPAEVWTWTNGPDRWTLEATQPADVGGESGTDVDPIEIGLELRHGYLQGSAVHGVLGLNQSCDARVYVRSARAGGGGDLDVGGATQCVAADANGDGVPDVAVPPSCDADDDCPYQGICDGGVCVVTELCVDATDCDANEDCSADGRCVARPGGTCEDDSTCDSRLCVSGACAVCTVDGGECGDGRRCGADGRCVDGADPGTGVGTGAGGGGADLAPGEEVQGGACTCSVIGRGTTSGAVVALLGGIAVAVWRRRAGGRR